MSNSTNLSPSKSGQKTKFQIIGTADIISHFIDHSGYEQAKEESFDEGDVPIEQVKDTDSDHLDTIQENNDVTNDENTSIDKNKSINSSEEPSIDIFNGRKEEIAIYKVTDLKDINKFNTEVVHVNHSLSIEELNPLIIIKILSRGEDETNESIQHEIIKDLLLLCSKSESKVVSSFLNNSKNIPMSIEEMSNFKKQIVDLSGTFTDIYSKNIANTQDRSIQEVLESKSGISGEIKTKKYLIVEKLLKEIVSDEKEKEKSADLITKEKLEEIIEMEYLEKMKVIESGENSVEKCISLLENNASSSSEIIKFIDSNISNKSSEIKDVVNNFREKNDKTKDKITSYRMKVEDLEKNLQELNKKNESVEIEKKKYKIEEEKLNAEILRASEINNQIENEKMNYQVINREIEELKVDKTGLISKLEKITRELESNERSLEIIERIKEKRKEIKEKYVKCSVDIESINEKSVDKMSEKEILEILLEKERIEKEVTVIDIEIQNIEKNTKKAREIINSGNEMNEDSELLSKLQSKSEEEQLSSLVELYSNAKISIEEMKNDIQDNKSLKFLKEMELKKCTIKYEKMKLINENIELLDSKELKQKHEELLSEIEEVKQTMNPETLNLLNKYESIKKKKLELKNSLDDVKIDIVTTTEIIDLLEKKRHKLDNYVELSNKIKIAEEMLMICNNPNTLREECLKLESEQNEYKEISDDLNKEQIDVVNLYEKYIRLVDDLNDRIKFINNNNSSQLSSISFIQSDLIKKVRSNSDKSSSNNTHQFSDDNDLTQNNIYPVELLDNAPCYNLNSINIIQSNIPESLLLLREKLNTLNENDNISKEDFYNNINPLVARVMQDLSEHPLNQDDEIKKTRVELAKKEKEIIDLIEIINLQKKDSDEEDDSIELNKNEIKENRGKKEKLLEENAINKLQDLYKQCDVKEKEYETLKEDVNKKIEDLNKQCEVKEKEYETLKEDVNKKIEERNLLKEERDKKFKISEEDTDYKNLEVKGDNIKEKKEKILQDFEFISSQTKEMDDLRSKYLKLSDRLIEDNINMERDLNNKRIEKDIVTNEIMILNNKLKNIENENNRLLREIKELKLEKEELERWLKMNRNQKSKIDLVATESNIFENKRDDLIKEIEDLKEERNNVISQNKQLKQRESEIANKNRINEDKMNLLTENCDEMEKKLKTMKKIKKSLKDEARALEINKSEGDKELFYKSNELSEIKNEIKNRMNELANIKSEIKNGKVEIEEIKEELKEEIKKISSTSADTEEIIQLFSKREKEYNEITEKLNEKKNELNLKMEAEMIKVNVQREVEELLRMKNELITRNHDLFNEQLSLEIEVEKLKPEQNTLIEQIKELVSQRDLLLQVQLKCRELKIEENERSERINRMEEQIRKMADEKIEIANEKEKITGEAKAMIKEKNGIFNEIEVIKADKERNLNEFKDTAEKLKEIQQNYEKKKEDLIKSLKDINSAIDPIEAAKKEHKKIKSESGRLIVLNEEMARRAKEKEAESGEIVKKITELNNEIPNLNSAIAELETKKDYLRKEIKSYEMSFDPIKKEIDGLKISKAKIEKELDKLEEKIKDSEREKRNLVNEIRELQNHLQHLRANKEEEMNREIKINDNKVKETEKEWKAKCDGIAKNCEKLTNQNKKLQAQFYQVSQYIIKSQANPEPIKIYKEVEIPKAEKQVKKKSREYENEYTERLKNTVHGIKDESKILKENIMSLSNHLPQNIKKINMEFIYDSKIKKEKETIKDIDRKLSEYAAF